jgi:hypothetical protein
VGRLLSWLTEKAKFPRFVWVVLALGICIVAGALGYRILTASSVMVNASEHLTIAVEAQKDALQERKEASELLMEMNARFDEARVNMDKRFDDLLERMERTKERFKAPEVVTFSTKGPREKIISEISTAQMALREDRETFRKEVPNFKDFRKEIAEKIKK